MSVAVRGRAWRVNGMCARRVHGVRLEESSLQQVASRAREHAAEAVVSVLGEFGGEGGEGEQ